MRNAIALAALLFLSGSAHASDKLDITPFLTRLGVCSVVTNRGDVLAGGCYTPISWSWGSGNIGVTWDTNDDGAGQTRGVGGAVASLGIRADKAFGWAWDRSGLEKKGVQVHFVVPKIEVGPMGGYVQRLGWVYGAFLNGKWPLGG